jgi:hypothetical protein
MKTGRRFGAIALVAIVGGALACTSDREEVMFQEGDFVFDFLVDQSLTGGVPGGTGTVNQFRIAAIDLSRAGPDEFGRSIAGNRSFYSSSGSQFGGAYNVTSFLGTSATDQRMPALTENDVTQGASPDGLVILDDSGLGFGGAFHNIFNDAAMSNLKPNTTYIVALFRYAMTVNGDLDAAQMLAGQTVDQPDQLVLAGGTGPAGDPTVPIMSFPTIVGYVTGANPFIVGNFVTDANGDAFFDGVIDGTGVLYADDSGDPPDAAFDSSLVARNDGTATNLPRYNYLVILEGPAVDAADAADNPQAVRFQIAQDIDASGAPIENAYAPFPNVALATVDLLGTNVAAGQASEIELSFSSLAELGGSAVYQVWLLNAETGDVISPTGDWQATELDSLGNPVVVASGSGVNTFTSQGTWTHTFTTSDALAGQPIGPYTHALISIESSAASQPSSSRPLFWQYTDMAGDPADPFGWSFFSPDAVLFGTLGDGTDPTPWAVSGRGEGGFWGQQVGMSDLLVVNFRNLQLPPVGYFYEAWLIDESGTPVPAGELETTFDEGRQSLRDLDVDPSLSAFSTQDGFVLRSETATTLSDVQSVLQGAQFYDFMEYRLTLSPKLGTGDMPPTTVLGGLVPEPVKERKPTEP